MATRSSLIAYEQGDYGRARIAVERALHGDPTDQTAWEMALRIAIAQGDAAYAREVYGRYIRARRPLPTAVIHALAVATLRSAIEAQAPELRRAAIEIIAMHQVEALAEPVLAAVEDADEHVAAAAALAVFHSHPGAPAAIDELLRVADEQLRASIVRGLGRRLATSHPHALADRLLPYLDAPNSGVRLAALEAMPTQVSPTVRQRLWAHFAQPKPDAERCAAAVAYARLRPPHDANARRTLGETLWSHPTPRCNLLAAALLAEHAPDVLRQRLSATAHPGLAWLEGHTQLARREPRAQPQLQQALMLALRAETSLRVAALNRLGAINPTNRAELRPLLLSLLEAPEVNVRIAAAGQLLAWPAQRPAALHTLALEVARVAPQGGNPLAAATELLPLHHAAAFAWLAAALSEPTWRAPALALARAHRLATPELFALLAAPNHLDRLAAADALLSATQQAATQSRLVQRNAD